MEKQPNIKIDLITTDPATNEFALYLVEGAPWDAVSLDSRLKLLHHRIQGALDVIFLGLLSKKYPESNGRKIRLQIDLHGGPPAQFGSNVKKLVDLLNNDESIRLEATKACEFISGFRAATRETMGRGKGLEE